MRADASHVSRRVCLPLVLASGATMVAAGLMGVGAEAAGSASHYTLTYAQSYYGSLDNHTLVHWARCTTIDGHQKTNVIDYRVNAAGHAKRVRLVKRAVAKLHDATGLTFNYLGRTDYIPHTDVSSITGLQTLQALEQRKKTGADLVVAWAYRGTGAHKSNLLLAGEDGVGTIKWASGPTSQLRILEAAVVMKRGVTLRPGFQAGGSVGTLVLHELGHAVGLQHVYNDTTQLMYPTLGHVSPSGYAAGDRTGLDTVGSTKCFTTKALPPSNN